ncbi:NAD(P) transhydrogenase subunit beta [Ectothiorhodospira haloalkaliphila]|uniref:NAD(P) transhydrogenase subunit beta n=1 Tax=Ectothiorhodospira haloalkaliphila TaxID=421628 RepID=W8KQL3_9GAMM|nr:MULTISPECIES: NAD(P)(+) transhydrogenase (Re/Si-specific) subunit beta [Ectothiorhodospira]AHK79297.1 NAD(P) transhydrogenase subunit beta [Ectothiorhodospira haloalkaliphila]MCG5495212.1 NAD(P)(+) transhydrogenase (Re/Si-specific) subunit beta [Ectothiorhodospira variabilis]MCG5498460.1 NAD(P)(+) transhydrogenase (Re/Si-specific) subunit beta [Ectothiorhodospira variabilis]MCG5504238.1 NAD(P)(+) transhydrogenase (Re/Si-specific) subunit beta [Ectothiorhodospira variabilis]MCG5507393.1 NAD(
MSFIVNLAYFAAAVLFIIGLKQMASPVTARRGIIWAGWGMVIATVVTFLHPEVIGFVNYLLIIAGIGIGGGLAWYTGKRVPMTDMPQMIALYNGMGGGAAAGIGIVALMGSYTMNWTIQFIAVAGVIIGSVAFSGSLIAYGKLQGLIKKSLRFDMQQKINLGVLGATVLLGIIIGFSGAEVNGTLLFLFVLLALAFGVLMTIPIGGADMPVVISLYNALTGLAVGLKGLVLDNAALMIAGIVVGAAGTLLTQLMAKAMNRPLTNVLFSSFGETPSGEQEEVSGSMKEIEASDAGVMMAFANKVIIVPGYGMAVAQAQHKIWELTQLLQERDVQVKFAIHPVAGRMPGHMNVLLAEAGVPYDIIYDLDEINNEFKTADVAVVIGANDVVNPVARSNPESPIYGMPILNADEAHNVIVIKRGKGAGFSGVENHLFYADNTRMLYGDGQKVAGELIASIKEMG